MSMSIGMINGGCGSSWIQHNSCLKKSKKKKQRALIVYSSLRDQYKTLRIHLGATTIEIDVKKAFRKLSLQVKAWAELLNAFCTSGKLELELIYKVQIQCYEDTKLMKLFPEIVRSLYDQDVLAEDTILLWFRKGTNPKGRQAFVKALEPFVNWLEEAEEEE